MKKFIKNNIFGFILGIVICSGISIIAYNYNADDISYTPSDTSWDVNNIQSAVDELYDKVNGSKEMFLDNGRISGDSNYLTATFSKPLTKGTTYGYSVKVIPDVTAPYTEAGSVYNNKRFTYNGPGTYTLQGHVNYTCYICDDYIQLTAYPTAWQSIYIKIFPNDGGCDNENYCYQ